MRERRSTIRIPVGVEGTYELAKGLGGPRLALSQDISQGGMRLVSAERLQPGDRIQISVQLPIQGPITMLGTVVWARETSQAGQTGYECGLRWTDLNPPSQARLNAFITGQARLDLTPSADFTPTLSSTIHWPRVAFVSFVVGGLITVIALYWLEWYRMTSEVRTLRQQVGNYRSLIEHTLSRKR